MSRSNPMAKDFWCTLFGNRESEQLEQELETYDEESFEARHQGERKPSLYVKVFADMINAILEKEGHLLSYAELDVLRVYNALEYPARYLLVRLVLRQPDWHPLSSLQKYSSEINEEGLEEALKTLCVPVKDMKTEQCPTPSPGLPSARAVMVGSEIVKEEEEDFIMLTSSGEEEALKPPIHPNTKTTQPVFAKPSTKISEVEIEEPIVDPSNLEFDYLFRDQSTMTVREALTRLTLPDLREISRSMKVGTPAMRKETLVNAMINYAASQHTLPSLRGKSKAKGKQTSRYDSLVQTQLTFGQKPKDKSQLKRLREMALQRLGPCLKINPNLYWLVGRLHIISYRGTEKPTKYCLPALLAGFKKWNFPDYVYERSGSIWPTREDFLEYEEALHLDMDMENPPEDVSVGANPAHDMRFRTPYTPKTQAAAPLQTPQSAVQKTMASDWATPVKKEEEELKTPARDEVEVPKGVKESSSIQRAKHIKKLYKERIEPKWRELLERKDQEKGKAAVRTPGLERFEAGHVYTRMVHKAASAFGMLKEYHVELAILAELLQQTHWRKGKRATWYERRAVILERYIKPYDFDTVKNGVLQALADEFTGIVIRPSLARRLERIQKKMKLHPEKRIVCEGFLKDPAAITITAKRTDQRPGVKLDQNLRPLKGSVPLLVSDFFPPKLQEKKADDDQDKKGTDDNTTVIQLVAPDPTPKRTGKSSWVGFSDEAVNIETYALQHYEMNGYVGFHSETRILTTIFALIFWDIIFSRVPGAFETQFQAGPLDMFEDSFYLSRRGLFEVRLREIREGKAREYLKRHDDRYRPKQTWCIGLRWDVCEQSQLIEIVECLGAETLAMICQLFCEDYAGRSSGVPDLIVWKAREGICKFVEVKGPGDNPQPNQKLWFDSLLRAGAHVEICRVLDQDAPEPKQRKRKAPTSKRKGKKGKTGEELQEQGSDDDGDYLREPLPKRRKADKIDLDVRVAPTTFLIAPLTITPSPHRRAHSLPVSAENSSTSLRNW